MQQPEFTLADAFRGVMSRKILVVGVFFATLVVVGVATIACPKSYTSKAKLFARLGRENAGMDATATLGEQPVITVPMSRESEMNSIVELLNSRQLIEGVVDDIGPLRILKRGVTVSDADEVTEEPPTLVDQMIDGVMGTLASLGVTNNVPLREKAVIKLQKGIDIKPIDKSHVVSVEYETHSPELAQEVVQKLADSYVAKHASLHRTTDAYTFLKGQTEAVRAELEEAEEALRELKNRTGLLSVEGELKIREARISRLDDELMDAATATAALQTEVDELEMKLETMSDTIVVESKTGAGNEGVDGMRQQLYGLELERNAMLARHKPSHPLVKQVERRLDEARATLAREEQLRTENTTGPNAVYEKTEGELILKRALLAAHQSRIDTLTAQRRQVEDEARAFTQDEIEFARLQRVISIKDTDFRKYSQNLAQAKIDYDLQQQSISNIEISQPATLNHKPSFPNKLINLVAGVVFGAFNAIGLATLLEYRKPRVAVQDIEQALDLPVVGSVSEGESAEELVAAGPA